jgi:hypothetical protein
MTLVITTGRIYTQDAVGNLTFDSNDKMFHVIGNAITGSFFRGPLSFGLTSPQLRFENTFVTTLPAGATHIRGIYSIYYSGGAYDPVLPNGHWTPIGGSNVLLHKRSQDANGNWDGDYPTSMAVGSFIVTPNIYGTNDVYYEEQYTLSDYYYNYRNRIIDSMSISYRIYPGTFT